MSNELWQDAIKAYFLDGDVHDLDGAIAIVLSDDTLMRAAAVFAVRRFYVDQIAPTLRDVMFAGASAESPLTDKEKLKVAQASRPRGASTRLLVGMIERGFSVLDTPLGVKKLGDYLPAELMDYGTQQVAAGKTTMLRGRFAKAVAMMCKDGEAVVRDQLTAELVEKCRQRVIEHAPEPEVAECALALV